MEKGKKGGVVVYMCQGQVLWKKLGSYPIELCSPLCSLLVSYAAHSVLGLSQLCPLCCGKGIPDQHLKGVRTGRTGAGLLNPAMHQQFMRCEAGHLRELSMWIRCLHVALLWKPTQVSGLKSELASGIGLEFRIKSTHEAITRNLIFNVRLSPAYW